MTAVTVGSTTDYTVDDPTYYSDINNQEPSSPTLSGSDLWLVDPTQLEGETTNTFFPEYSVTNLSETVDQNLIVPFENIDNEEPEITFGTLSTVADETFEVDSSTSDSIDTAVVTGNIDLATSTSSSSIDSTSSQLSGAEQTASFSEGGGGTSDGVSGESLSQLSSGGTSDGTSESESAGSGETSSEGGASGEIVSNGDITEGGDISSTGSRTGSGETSAGDTTFSQSPEGGETFQSVEGTAVSEGSTSNPTDVPFSLTESLGLSLLIGIVGLHKVLKQRRRSLNVA